MKVNITKRRKWLLGGGLLLLTATPGFALFGVGDIVFDPQSYASLVSQLTTIKSQYNMLKNNIEHFSAKQQWQTALHTLENLNVANMFGESAGLRVSLNSNSPSASITAWKTATTPVSSNVSTYLEGQALGSPQMSQLAMVEMSDAISPDCITAVGAYRTARTQNATANTSLATFQLDGTSATNSEVQQLNLLNAAEAQKMPSRDPHRRANLRNASAVEIVFRHELTEANFGRCVAGERGFQDAQKRFGGVVGSQRVADRAR